MLFAETRAKIPERCRTIIVGSGLAGMELVKELERRGIFDVLVLEAGPEADLRHVNVAHSSEQALRKWLTPETDSSFRQPWTSQTPPHYTGSSGIRQRLGGRSLYWHGVVLPIEPWALAEPWWPASVIVDLCESWEGGASLYERVERELIDWCGKDHWTALNRIVAASFGGHHLRATPRATRQSSLSLGRWYSYSPLDRWRHPETGEVLRRPSGFCVRTNVEVLKIAVRGGATYGVVVREASRRDQVEIAAEVVVLAAGTLENGRLAVQALTDARAISAPRLGRLADHIVQGVLARVERSQRHRLVSLLSPGSYFAPCPEARSNLFLDVRVLPSGDVFVDLQLTGEQMPSEASELACEATESVPWPVRVRTSTCKEDLEVIAAQQQILQEVWGEFARTIRYPTTLEFADYNNPERTYAFVLSDSMQAAPAGPATWSSFLGTEDHEGGALPFGSVLNDDHEFVAIRGLFAAGPSTFPRLGAANPGLTTLALAHRLAAKLACNS